MAYNVIMPKTGMAMEEGTVVRWLKKVGETPFQGRGYRRDRDGQGHHGAGVRLRGTLLAIVHGDGEVVKATATIAWIGAAGEKVPHAAGSAAAAAPAAAAAVLPASAPTTAVTAAPSGRVLATPAARVFAAASGIALSSVAGTGPGGAVRLRDLQAAKSLKATPLARRVAEIHSVDLEGIPRARDGGKIRKADVEARASVPVQAAVTAMTGMRRAHRGQDAAQPPAGARRHAGHACRRHGPRGPAGAHERGRRGQGLLYRFRPDAAAAVALREHPLMNSVLEGETIVLRAEINIGIAVALEAGLIVPVVRGADALGVRQISAAGPGPGGTGAARAARAGRVHGAAPLLSPTSACTGSRSSLRSSMCPRARSSASGRSRRPSVQGRAARSSHGKS